MQSSGSLRRIRCGWQQLLVQDGHVRQQCFQPQTCVHEEYSPFTLAAAVAAAVSAAAVAATLTTTRAAADFGYPVTVVHDACATMDLQFGATVVPAAQVHATAMAALAFAYGTITSTAEYLAQI